MANERNIWVIGGKDGWKVKPEGSPFASSSHRTQNSAWEEAKRLARQSHGDAVLQGLDGRIKARDSYS